jgi:hypothetical protein
MINVTQIVKGMDQLDRLPDAIRVAIFGTNGGIGQALMQRLSAHPKVKQVESFSRRHPDPSRRFDFRYETSIASLGERLAQQEGWHSYRAAKAALNMMIKGFALEMKHKNPEAVIIGLHPGTTDTGLSAPFQSSLKHPLFTPDEAAGHLLALIDGVNPSHSGSVIAWDGQIIPA